MPYLNIHTHQPDHTATLAIQNIILGEPDQPTTALPPMCSIGIHPWYISDPTSQLNQLAELANSPKAIMIGEAGLDKLKGANWELQLEVFKRQIAVSEKFKKPMIIHCVKAYNEILKSRQTSNATQPWIFHGFSGSPQMMHQIIKEECYISFGDSILHTNRKSTKAIISIPHNSLFLETDESDAPISKIYQQASSLLNIPETELVETINNNYQSLFLK